MQTFKGKTILITGASSGIGEAMARQLIDPSVTLLLTARSEHRLRRLAEELQMLGTRADVFPHDLSQPGGAARLHRRVTEAGHTIEVLINNAAFGKYGRFDAHDLAIYEAMLTLNVTNLISLTRLCIPGMLGCGDAGILNVASTSGFRPVPYMAVYGATKSFVLSFSEALHAEYHGRGITVTCLCPGTTRTRFADRAKAPRAASVHQAETPEKVAQVGLKALLEGEMTKVSGTGNTVEAVAAQIAPRRLVVSAARRVFAPKEG